MNSLNKSIKTILLIGGIALATTLVSCKKKKTEAVTPVVSYESGVLVVNEGPFGSGTGTVSHYNKNSQVVTNDIFQLTNQFPLGNIVQSINFINGKGYIVVNNTNKIIIVEQNDFKYTGTITGFASPRTILQIDNDKAYVTEWGSGGFGKINILNLSTNTISGSIAIQRSGPENMLKKGNLVYVTCKGGYGADSVVTVINSSTDAIVTNITVGANPDDIKEDINGDIWILCAGKYKSDYSSLEIPGSLAKINPTNNAVTTSFSFSSIYSQPAGLELNSAKDKLYFNYDGGINSQSITTTSLDNTILVARNFYSLGIDPTTNIIYAGDAGNYSSEGKVIRYSSNGLKIDSLNVGIIPGSFYFK